MSQSALRVRQEQMPATMESPEQVVGVRDLLVGSLINSYLHHGIVYERDDPVKALVADQVLNDSGIKYMVVGVFDGLQAQLQQQGRMLRLDPNHTNKKILIDADTEAFARAYAMRSADLVINGHTLSDRQMEGWHDLGKAVKKDPAPKAYYGHIKTVLIAAAGEAIVNKDFDALAQISDLDTIVMPSLDHPTNHAMSSALDLVRKIESGRTLSRTDYARMRANVVANVPSAVQPLASTACENYQIVTRQIANYVIEQKDGMDDRKYGYYCKLLENLLPETVSFNVYEGMGLDDDAEAYDTDVDNNEPVLIDVVANYDESSGKVSGAKVEISTSPRRYKALVATGVVAAFIGTAATVNLPSVTPSPTPEAGKPPVEEAATALGSPLTTYVVPQSESPSEPTTQPKPPTEASESYQGLNDNPLPESLLSSQPELNHVGNLADIPEVHIGADATPLNAVGEPQVSGEPTYTMETIKNSVREDLLEVATKKMADFYLQAKPNAELDGQEAFVDKLEEITDSYDARLEQLFNQGKISKDNYFAAREKLTQARVLAYFDLDGPMNIDLKRDVPEFTKFYIERELMRGGMLGKFKDSPRYALVLQLVGEAASTVISDQAQANILSQYQTSQQPEAQQNNDNHEVSGIQDKVVQEVLKRMENDGPLWKDRAIMLRGLMNKGYSLAFASGFVGNACVEAHDFLKYKEHGRIIWDLEQIGGGPGRASIMWGSNDAGDRFGHIDGANQHGSLLWFAAQEGLAWQDPEAQIGFIDWELHHTETRTLDLLQGVTSPRTAARIIVTEYERAGEPNTDLREDLAEQTFNRFNEIRQDILREQNAQNIEAPGNPSDNFFEQYTDIMRYLTEKYGSESGHLGAKDLDTLGETWGKAQLYPDAAATFRIMSAAFESEFGRPLQMSSAGASNAYRSYAEQVRLKDEKPDLAATPGTSNHGWGLSIDLGGGVNLGPGSPEYEWLTSNADRYGWGQEDFAKPGGSKPEPWHWTYVGGKQVVATAVVHTVEAGGNEQNVSKIEVPVSSHGYAHPVDPSLVHNLGTLYNGYENVEGFHTGWDYEVATGTNVYPVRPGVITQVGYDGDGAGNYIEIRHPDGTYSDYQHLSAENVEVGQTVQFGEQIGRVGNTGHSYGEHLHVTLRERGVDSFVSRLDDQVEAKTIDPITVMPSMSQVNEWLDDNRQRIALDLGRIATSTDEDTSEDAHGDVFNELEQRLGKLSVDPPLGDQQDSEFTEKQDENEEPEPVFGDSSWTNDSFDGRQHEY